MARASERLPLWDMAVHGVSGQRLASELAQGDPIGFLAQLHDLSVWPPVYALVEAPAFLAFGMDYAVPRVIQAILWCLVIVATLWAPWPLGAARNEGPPARGNGFRDGEIAGLLAASLFAGSAFFAGYATLNLLEMPSLLLVALCLGWYLRAVEVEEEIATSPRMATDASTQGRRARLWRAVALSSLGLFLCKYNYGLLWLLPLALAEGRRRVGSWPSLLRRLAAYAGSLSVRHLSSWVIAMLFLAMVVIRVTGGVDTEIAGISVRATSLGGPAYGIFVLVLWRFVTPWRRAVECLRGQAIGCADRELLRFFLVPVILWMLLPPHLKDFVEFVENRSEGPAFGSADWWAYYPRLLPEVFGPLAIPVLVMAAVGVVHVAGTRYRVVALAVLVWSAALLIHPYKLPRFALSGFWWLGVAAAVGMVAAAHRLRPSPLGRWPVPVLAFWLAGSTALAGVDLEKVAAAHRVRTIAPEVHALLDVLCEPEARRRGRVVLGTWNQLSPALIEWHCRRLDALSDGSWPMPRSDLELSRRQAHELIAELDGLGGGDVVWLDRPADPRWRLETEWLEPVRLWLQGSPSYRQAQPAEPLQVGGYLLEVFTPARSQPSAEGSPSPR